ncbi:zinc finger protein 660-like isoform X2 [Sardina pilchardus]|uniref:zinc finger protein 660-like isoform X2 n=1 Tax=Sardina pilchardus TaxID=27697 RepID=UPI002E127899
MVITCIVKGCDNKQKTYSAVMFHRFPTHHKRRKTWLAALNMDPTTPVVILKNVRVCSEHFTQEDYTSTGLRLKDAATPTILKSRTQQSGSSPNSGEWSDVQQNLPEVQNASPQKTSTVEEPATDFRLPLQQCDDLVNGMDFLSPLEPQKSGVRSGLMEDVVVKVACLLELFQNCFGCYSDACSVSTQRKGLAFHVIQQCWSCGNTRNWASHPPDLQPPDPTVSQETPQESEPGSEDMEEEEEEDEEEEDEKEEEEEEEDAEEEDEEEEEEEHQESEKRRPKRKRKNSDEEWGPSSEEFAETSSEESEGVEGEEHILQIAWCCDCGEEASARCFKQKHLQLYCCIKCGYRDGDQELVSTDGNSHGVFSIREQFSVGSSDKGTRNESPEDSASQVESSNSCHQKTGAANEKRNPPKYAVYFSDPHCLQIHLEELHGEKRELCPDCGNFLMRGDGRSKHVCDHKAKLFLCLTCGKRCVNEVGLRIHSHVHTEDYVLSCQYCYKTFRFLKDKQEHEETHQGENLKYRCPECPKQFADCASRSAHRRTHWEHGRFFCKVCDKGFPKAHHLKRHMAVHTGQKPYRCKMCNYSFNQSGHLKSHMRVHTGEKPFKCQDCGQCFNHNVSLKNHIQHHHTPGPEGH